MRLDDLIQNIQERDMKAENISFLEIEEEEVTIDEDKYFVKFNENELKVLTNFNKEEIMELFSIVEDTFSLIRNNRGRRIELSNLDLFLMFLVYFKTYMNINSLALNFKISPSTASRHINKMIDFFHSIYYKKFTYFYNKDEQIEREIGFSDFPNVALVLDCSIQEVSRYAGSFEDVKKFFSNKHKKYSLKKEYGHMPNGRVSFISKTYKGAVHDFSIFKNNVELYKKNLKFNDTFFEIMADKGYEGINKITPSITPHKQKRNEELGPDEKRTNRRIAACRSIVEQYYGRMKKLFGIARLKYKGEIQQYDKIINITVALTNYHMEKKPLRQTDATNLRRLVHVENSSVKTNSELSSKNKEGSNTQENNNTFFNVSSQSPEE